MTKKPFLLLIVGLLIITLCTLTTLVAFGSGLAVWFTSTSNASSEISQPTRRLVNLAERPASPTPTATPIAIPTATFTPTPTETPIPSPTPTPSPSPTDTPLPSPTNTATSPPPPPTSTPLPTDTPLPTVPAYPFVIAETAKYDTNHLNFDVYIAITDADNKPLSNYRVIGTHSSGLQLESQVSAGDWTQNSGAMHYKAGNIKYESFNSPSGIWTLQLVDADGNPVAEPVEFPFDAGSPTWYFLLYRLK